MKTLVTATRAALMTALVSSNAYAQDYTCTVNTGPLDDNDEIVVSDVNVPADGKLHRFPMKRSGKGKGVQIRIEKQTSGYYAGYLTMNAILTEHVENDNTSVGTHVPYEVMVQGVGAEGSILSALVFDSVHNRLYNALCSRK